MTLHQTFLLFRETTAFSLLWKLFHKVMCFNQNKKLWLNNLDVSPYLIAGLGEEVVDQDPNLFGDFQRYVVRTSSIRKHQIHHRLFLRSKKNWQFLSRKMLFSEKHFKKKADNLIIWRGDISQSGKCYFCFRKWIPGPKITSTAHKSGGNREDNKND